MTNEKKISVIVREIMELRSLRTEINIREDMLELLHPDYRQTGDNILGAAVHLERIIKQDALSLICNVCETEDIIAANNALFELIEMEEDPTVVEVSAKLAKLNKEAR